MLLETDYKSNEIFGSNEAQMFAKVFPRLVQVEEKNSTCYKGVIVPVSWDQFDRPKEFSLFIDSENEFLLRPINKAHPVPLHYYTNKEVVVCGEVGPDELLHYYFIHPDIENNAKENISNLDYVYINEHEVLMPNAQKLELIH